MPYRDAVETHGPFSSQPARPVRTWRLVHHRGPNLGDDTEYTVTVGGDDSATIREIHGGRVTATLTLPAAVVRALAPVLADAVSHDEPPVAEVDPDLERLLREEDEIEARAANDRILAEEQAAYARVSHVPSYHDVPLQVMPQDELWYFVSCGRCMCVLVNDVEGANLAEHTAWHAEHG